MPVIMQYINQFLDADTLLDHIDIIFVSIFVAPNNAYVHTVHVNTVAYWAARRLTSVLSKQ